MLQLPEARHLLPSQRRISEIQAFEIEIADDSGIAPKNAHEFASRRVGGSGSLSYTRRDHKNHLRTKRQRELKYGEAGSMLKYFQDKSIENPSFQHVVQLDCDEQIANVFWADAKMIIDYAHFGDVVTSDTTFGTNKEYRPFGVFVGFNHFRETVIFGASLLYDETFESFKWLFRAFLSVHNQKQPQTIFTDQDTAMGNAIEHVFSESKHGLCTFHIMQNAIKHLPNKKKDGETEDTPQEVDDEENGSSLLKDFSACMYEYDDPETFEEAFKVMRSKVKKQTWMDSIYKVKVKLAQCFMREAFTLGMRSTQLSESLNNDLKNHLKSDLDINRFFM
jgi:zinc finger SWIM domain-containing protein 3